MGDVRLKCWPTVSNLFIQNISLFKSVFIFGRKMAPGFLRGSYHAAVWIASPPRWWSGDKICLLDPSASFFEKQLFIILRFSSSNLSALEDPDDGCIGPEPLRISPPPRRSWRGDAPAGRPRERSRELMSPEKGKVFASGKVVCGRTA